MTDTLQNVAADLPDAGPAGAATSTSERPNPTGSSNSGDTGGTGDTGGAGGGTASKFVTFAPLTDRVYRATPDSGGPTDDNMKYKVLNESVKLTTATWLYRSSVASSFEVINSTEYPSKIGGQALAAPPFKAVAYDQVDFTLSWFLENSDYLAKDLQLKIAWQMNELEGVTTSGLFAVIDSKGGNSEFASEINRELNQKMAADPSLEGGETTTTGSSPKNTGDSGQDGGAPNPSQTASVGHSSSKSGGGLSIGAKAGIGVGAALGALLLIGVLVWFLLRRRRQKKNLESGYKGKQSSNTYMVDKETQGRVTESPTSPYLDDSQGQRVPLTDIETARDAPTSHAPYEDTPAPRSSLGSQGERERERERGTGTETPQGVTTNVAHLVEEGMTEDEIRRLEEEERQLDDEIERAARR